MPEAPPLLSCQNLVKDFNGFRAVDGINLELQRGEVLGLLGANGAGKTTTMNMMLGLTTPTDGEIEVFGLPLKKHRREILSRANFSSAYTQLPGNLLVEQNLGVFARLYGLPNVKERVEEVMELFGVTDLRRKNTGDLSAGQSTRVNLCKAFLNEPELLLLDEPTASLDPDVVDQVRTLIRRKQSESNVSMIYTSHNMRDIEVVCDRVIFVHKGQVIREGTPQEIKDSFEEVSLENVFIRIARGGELKESETTEMAGRLDLSMAKRTLDREERAVENAMIALTNDLEAADRAYDGLPATRGGKIIAPDEARHLSPEFASGREGQIRFKFATDRVAKAYAEDRLFRDLERLEPGNLVLNAGGMGAGKTSTLRKIVQLSPADLVYDSTLSNLKAARKLVKFAIAKGWTIRVVYTFRPFGQAVEAAIQRTVSEGRSVDLSHLSQVHRNSQQTVLALAEEFRDDRGLAFYFLLNQTQEAPVRLSEEEIAKGGQFHYDKTDVDYNRKLACEIWRREAEREQLDERSIEQLGFGFRLGRDLPSSRDREPDSGCDGSERTRREGIAKGKKLLTRAWQFGSGVHGIVLRYAYLYTRNPLRLFELFFWPIVHMVLWGFTTKYLQTRDAVDVSETGQVGIFFLIGGVFLWDVMFRASQGVSISFLEDVWTRNLLNIFVTPLHTAGMVIGMCIVGLLRVCCTAPVLYFLGLFGFGFDVFDLNFWLILFYLNLLLFGWSLGMIANSLIMRWGQSAEGLSWAIPFMVQPLCAIFYEVSVLPMWLQKLTFFVPASHVFEGMRDVLADPTAQIWDRLGLALLMNTVWLVGAGLILGHVLRIARERGLLVKVATQ